MQAPTQKTYFAEKMGLDAKQIVAVAVTPCTAKKFEIRRDEMNSSAEYWDTPEMRDTDYCSYYTGTCKMVARRRNQL